MTLENEMSDPAIGVGFKAPGVEFISVTEGDEIVEGRDFPPRPVTIKVAVTAYRELVATYGPENVIAIAPFKDKSAGVKELNNAIRAALGFGELAQAGDLLMITKNDRDIGVLNGQRYRVTGVSANGDRAEKREAPGSEPPALGGGSKSKGEAKSERSSSPGGAAISAVLLGARHKIMLTASPRTNARGPCKNVDWGYVATVHKFQGSESDAVLVVVPSGTLRIMRSIGGEKTPWFFDRSCLYTACSRAKLALVLVGDPDDIKSAAELNQSVRITALPRLLHPSVRARPTFVTDKDLASPANISEE